MVVASPVGRKLYEVNNNSGVATNPAVHMHMLLNSWRDKCRVSPTLLFINEKAIAPKNKRKNVKEAEFPPAA